MAQAGKQSVVTTTNLHLESYRAAGIGLFYGDQSVYSAVRKVKPGQKVMNNSERIEYVRRHLRPEFSKGLRTQGAIDSYLTAMVGDQDSEPRAGMIQMTNPLLWTYRHLEVAYTTIGRSARWQQIVNTVEAQPNRGLALMKELQKDGWEAVYWNPDLQNPESKKSPHGIAAVNAQKFKVFSAAKYKSRKEIPSRGLLKIDHLLLNYRQGAGARERASVSDLEKLKTVPFWVGLANFGSHVFVGHHGMISESSSSYAPETPLALQRTSFSSWGGSLINLPREGAPKAPSSSYLSGILMVPPGTWN